MAIKEDFWYLLSVIVMSVVVSNFTLRQVSDVNANLLDIVLGSSKVERFAEALGYYAPTAVADSITVQQGAAPFVIDVLDNDFDEDHFTSTSTSTYGGTTTYTTTYYNGELYIELNSQISNITGDTGAVITVDSSVSSSNSDGYDTFGNVIVDTTDTFSGTLTFDYQVCDGPLNVSSSQCNTETVTVNVGQGGGQGQNTPPFVSNIGINVPKDGFYGFFPQIFSSAFFDPDIGDSLVHIRIDALPQNGVLTLNGTSVNPAQTIFVGGLSDLIYTPNAGYTGSDNFAWSGSDGADFSQAPALVNITVEPNNPPTVNGFIVNFDEGDTYIFAISDFEDEFSDTDNGDTMQEIQIINPMPSRGVLTFNGNPVVAGDVIARADITNLVYTPNSTTLSGSDSFGWNGSDGEDYANSGQVVSININAVDNVPTATSFNITTPYETSFVFNNSEFDNNFDDEPDATTQNNGEFWNLEAVQILSLPANGTLTYTDLSGQVNVTVNDFIPSSELATLTYTPNNSYTGPDSFDWLGIEAEGGGGGGIRLDFEVNSSIAPQETSNIATVNITVQGGVNQPPIIDNARIGVLEDTDYIFAPHDFSEESSFGSGTDGEGYADPEDEIFTQVRIESLPNQGDLIYDGSTLEAADLPLEIDRADIPNLLYRPLENFNNGSQLAFSGDPSPEKFTFNVRDDIQYGDQPGEMEIYIFGVNDAPVVEGFDVSFLHDTNWYFDMPQDPNNNCFTAHFSDIDVNSQDFQNESWELGGIRLVTNPQHGDLYVYPTGGTYAGQPYAWTQGLVIARDDIDSMVYIPDPGYAGVDTFEWEATDELITESGGGGFINYEWSNTATTTLNIQASNEVPTNQDFGRTTEYQQPYNFARQDFLDNYNDVDNNNLDSITITSLPNSGTLTYLGANVTVGQSISYAGDTVQARLTDLDQLVYTPNQAFVGSDTFDYLVNDGIEDAASPATVTVTTNDYQDLQIILTSDTPSEDIVIDEQVCVTAGVTNPNNYTLENVVVRLTTDPARLPFLINTFSIPNSVVATNITDTDTEFTVTLQSLAANQTVDIANCALPKSTDISIIDGSSFLLDNPRIVNDEVELNPPSNVLEEMLIRTGGDKVSKIWITVLLQSVIMGLLWMWAKFKKSLR